MIQLGSILAVMWLYRAKIVRVLRGLPSDPDARHFALMILVAFAAGGRRGRVPVRLRHSACSTTTPAVIATTFVVGGDRDAARRAVPAGRR